MPRKRGPANVIAMLDKTVKQVSTFEPTFFEGKNNFISKLHSGVSQRERATATEGDTIQSADFEMFKGRIWAKVHALPVLGTKKRNFMCRTRKKYPLMWYKTFKFFGTLDSKSDLLPIKTNGIPFLIALKTTIKN